MQVAWCLETSPANRQKAGRSHPTEGLNSEKKAGSYMLHHVMNPTGGAKRWARRKGYLVFRDIMQLPPSCFQRSADILHPTTVRCSLGTAWCGPACQVVWGGREKNPPLPDWAFSQSLTIFQHTFHELEE